MSTLYRFPDRRQDAWRADVTRRMEAHLREKARRAEEARNVVPPVAPELTRATCALLGAAIGFAAAVLMGCVF